VDRGAAESTGVRRTAFGFRKNGRSTFGSEKQRSALVNKSLRNPLRRRPVFVSPMSRVVSTLLWRRRGLPARQNASWPAMEIPTDPVSKSGSLRMGSKQGFDELQDVRLFAEGRVEPVKRLFFGGSRVTIG